MPNHAADSLLDLLGRPEPYAAQIDRLRAKYGRMRRLDGFAYRGLSLADLGTQADELSRLLARAVSRGEYELGPVVVQPAMIGGKRRRLCRSNLPDTIVLGVVAQVLGAMAEPALSPRVYSYRAGRSSWQTLLDLRGYFREHVTSRPVRERGLYVLHRDVRNYGESIPTERDSVIWQELDRVFERAAIPATHPLCRLAVRAFRPDVVATPDGDTPRVGVPTGSPVQTVACNLYLSTVDRLLEAVPGAFYARFGDDMLFCHPDAAVARRAAYDVDRVIAGLCLEVKPEKRRDYYLTGPGRPSTAWADSRPTSRLDYLGFRLDLEGHVGLKGEKGRRLLRELRARVGSAAAGAERTFASDDDRARAVCGAIARALDPASPLADPAAAVLRYVVNDREQLRYFDHAVALAVAEALARTRGPRAFRAFPYRVLRTRAGLPSLVVNRNGARSKGTERR